MENSNDINPVSKEIILQIAHDFNNLLVGISGNARLLAEQEYVAPQGIRLVQDIMKCADRAADLTARLLTLDGADKPQSLRSRIEKLPSDFHSSDPVPETTSYSERGNDTVLVIDDEEVVRSVSSAILTRAGYRVIATGSGKEGVEIFENHFERIRCVLLDLTMPYIRGNLVFARLKASDPDVKVFLMSGYTNRQALREFDTESVVGFIQKPFDPEEILRAVKSVSSLADSSSSQRFSDASEIPHAAR